MEEIRAIYIADIKQFACPVFKLNKDTGYFEMIVDKSFQYKKEEVYSDSNFIIFELKDGDNIKISKVSLCNK